MVRSRPEIGADRINADLRRLAQRARQLVERFKRRSPAQTTAAKSDTPTTGNHARQPQIDRVIVLGERARDVGHAGQSAAATLDPNGSPQTPTLSNGVDTTSLRRVANARAADTKLFDNRAVAALVQVAAVSTPQG